LGQRAQPEAARESDLKTVTGITSRSPTDSYPAGMDDLLDALQALRPLWLPLLGLSLISCVGVALIAWG
jgi:hypothetical protein